MALPNVPLPPDPIPAKPPLTTEEKELIRTLYCAGEKATNLSKRFGVTAKVIYHMAQRGKWATPQRVGKARRGETIATNDPATEVAMLWNRRGETKRESVYHGATKALERFFAFSPVPQSFKEAQIASDMADKAINPNAGAKPGESPGLIANVNLAFLTNNIQPVPEQPPLDV